MKMADATSQRKPICQRKRFSTATDLELILAETDTEDEVRSLFAGSIRTKTTGVTCNNCKDHRHI